MTTRKGGKIRLDGTYLLSTDKDDNPKLYARQLPDGRESLYLEYYFGYSKIDGIVKTNRHKEQLRLYIYTKPQTPIERQQNKETLELAKKIRFERGQQVLQQAEGYRLKRDRQVNFLDYFLTYIDKYTKKDIRVMEMALRRFKSFLADTPEYRQFAKSIKPEQITRDMMADFVEYLQTTSTGEGAHTIYQRFKKVILYAIEHDVMAKNPCKGISIVIDNNKLTKDILSQDEIQTLLQTHYTGQNNNIRRAFIFSLYTGLRFCDVKELEYSNVDYSNRLLRFEQNKTVGHSSSSWVVIPLNDSLLSLIGQPEENGKDSLVFPLPSNTMCLKALKTWTAKAGINKHITWHCARHSFATNILSNGANIKTVASLMGHSTVTYTQKYTRAIDSLKMEAINSLPELDKSNF